MIPGDLFDGKYRILKILGAGGMGIVYLAQNVRLGSYWAIKQISRNSNPRIDILMEPNILKKLNHPALPRIFDVVEDEDNIYAVFDYIEGASLDNELNSGVKFSEETVLQLTRQICDVLKYLHNFKPNPIIYRDMKPSNIILTEEGIVKLIDFGIAREYKEGSNSDTINIGTRGYAAPEQYNGFQQTDARTDIYSLGMTLYHLVTRKNPNDPPYEVKPARYFNSALSQGLEYIIGKCTRQNPNERYQSVEELLYDIENIADLQAAPASDWDKSSERTQKYISFKKLILAIPDNAEFACELAYTAAKITDLRIIIIDLDFISSKLQNYMNVKFDETYPEAQGFITIKKALEAGKACPEIAMKACCRIRELHNLYVLTEPYHTDNYEMYRDLDLEGLMEYAYRSFDITILITGKAFDRYTKAALARSDYILAAIPGNTDNLDEYGKYMVYARDRYAIPLEKFRFAAWEYKKGINLPVKLLQKAYTGQAYSGYISYQVDREKYRNLEGACYTKEAYKRHFDEYRELLAHFNILSRPALKDKITNFSRWLGMRPKSILKPHESHK